MSDPQPPGEPIEPPSGDDAPADATPPADAAAEPAAPAARPYLAPDLDAPQYAVPAYAAPTPAEAATTPHGAPSAASPYALPPGYALPGPGARASAEVAALPPYAQGGAAPTPGVGGYPATSGHPGAPGYRGLPGDPAAAGTPSPSFGGQVARPRTLAVVALVIAGIGVLLAFLPYALGVGAGWLSPLFLFTAFVLSLIALASRNQGGKGFGAAALATSVLGGVLAVVVAVAWIFGSFATSYDGAPEPGGDQGTYDDYAVPGLAAPGTDGLPDAGAEFAPPVALTVAETAFGRDYGDVWWYVVVVDNPNADYVFDAFLDAQAFDEEGALVSSGSSYTSVLSGRTAVVGYFTVEGGEQIARMEVRVPPASEATLSPAGETGSFTVDGVSAASDGAAGGSSTHTAPGTVSGTVSGRFADDQQYVAVTVIARDPAGGIAAVSTAYLEEVPGDGTPVPFEAWFAELPGDAAFEAYAHR